MIERHCLVAIAGAAVVVAGLAGCSSNKSSSAGSSNSSPASVSSGPSQPKVLFDGRDQGVEGDAGIYGVNW